VTVTLAIFATSIFNFYSQLEHYSLHKIKTLVQDFELQSLPKSLWTHEAHVVVAAWYSFHLDEQEAYGKMKENIIALNVAVGVANDRSAGYHDTLTRFWLLLLKKYQLFNTVTGVTDLVNGFILSGLSGKHIPLRLYSKKLLYSAEARQSWMLPDKQPLSLLSLLIDPKAEPHFQLSDFEFENQFRDCSLNASYFSHEAHLRLAYIYLKKYGLKKTILLLTKDIRAFARSLGAETKYHATLTIAAIHVVDHFMKKGKSAHFYDFIYEFPRLKTNFRDLIAQHYNQDIYQSDIARSEFVAPDLQPFA
jgi:hypothetical protein